MASLAEVAERAQNMYYQDYAPDDAFFDVEDFKFQAAAYYSKIINDQYQILRKENRAETGFGSVDLAAQWLWKQEVEKSDKTPPVASQIKFDEERNLWYVDTSYPIFAFAFDGFANGLNGVRAYSNPHRLKKLNVNETRFSYLLPTTTDIYYWVEGTNRILFNKNPSSKLSLHYIPAVIGSNDQCVMADTIVADVIEKTLTIMFGAKNGNIIDKTDDKNRNEVLPGEINPEAKKQ